jgi:hypothetical protein
MPHKHEKQSISLPIISLSYVENMIKKVKLSNDIKKNHKYTKWILCMTFILPIIHLCLINDPRMNIFIHSKKSFRVSDSDLVFYEILIPQTPVLCLTDIVGSNIKQYMVDFLLNLSINAQSKESRLVKKMLTDLYIVRISDNINEDLFCIYYRKSSPVENEFFLRTNVSVDIVYDRTHVNIHQIKNNGLANVSSFDDFFSTDIKSSYHQDSMIVVDDLVNVPPTHHHDPHVSDSHVSDSHVSDSHVSDSHVSDSHVSDSHVPMDDFDRSNVLTDDVEIIEIFDSTQTPDSHHDQLSEILMNQIHNDLSTLDQNELSCKLSHHDPPVPHNFNDSDFNDSDSCDSNASDSHDKHNVDELISNIAESIPDISDNMQSIDNQYSDQHSDQHSNDQFIDDEYSDDGRSIDNLQTDGQSTDEYSDDNQSDDDQSDDDQQSVSSHDSTISYYDTAIRYFHKTHDPDPELSKDGSHKIIHCLILAFIIYHVVINFI